MASNTVQEIEQAIGTLTPQEVGELCAWLDEYQHGLDARMESDLGSGRMDDAILRALADERDGRVQPL